MYTVDVIIPTYKPDKEFLKLISILEHQTYPVHKIIIMNTEEQYFTGLTYNYDLSLDHSKLEVHHISKMEFDHAGTRRTAVEYSTADFFVCMTQDAMPADETLIENLLKPLITGEAQGSYARQVPYEDAGDIERFTRKFNYPKQSHIKSSEDMERMGIKTYFCSNVCAAYNRSVYEELGGFPKFAIFNEDMIYASKLINAGGKIAYVAEAVVFHSHNYTAKEQFHRNFDNGVSQAENPDIFDNLPAEGEGKRMVSATAKYLVKNKKWYMVPKLIVHSGAKYIGFKLGKNYTHFKQSRVLKWTMNQAYWEKKNIRNATVNIDPYAGYGIGPNERK